MRNILYLVLVTVFCAPLKATAEMASYLGDKKFAKTCEQLYTEGSEWMDANLFNGEYYVQHIQPPMSADNVAESLIGSTGSNGIDLASPDFQLGEGVLVDQLIGQVFAHIIGLGYMGDEANIKQTTASIMKYNYVDKMYSHANFFRSYAIGNESALLMAAYPGERPEKPFPYFTEVMTGFEYTAAIGMLQEGQTEDGLKCIRNIRERYDGRNRSLFDEAECGHHYSRSMIAWAGILATSGFHYSGVEKSIRFTSKPGTYFWSNGYSWGTCTVKNYDLFLKTVKSAFNEKDINSDCIEDYLITSGIIWMQGESDANDEEVPSRYYFNLKRLLDLLRATFRDNYLTAVIGKILDSGNDEDGKVWDYGELVQYAQEK